MEPQHAQRKPRYALYFGLLALGIAASAALIGFPFVVSGFLFGGA